jgi:hypothetical protein
MSTMRRIQIYAAVLFVLLALFVTGTILGPRRGRALGMVFPGLEAAAVQGIDISSGDSAVTIERQDASWVIDEGSRGYPARSDRVESFLDEAVASGLVRHITGNENLWPDFELTDEAGALLTLRSGADGSTEQVQSVVWGGAAAEPGLSFLRFGAAPDVYASDGELQFYLRQPTSYWSNLRVLPENIVVADVIALSSSVDVVLAEDQRLTHAYDMERETTESGDLWYASIPGGDAGLPDVEPFDTQDPLDSNAVAGLVREVVDLVGSDFSREVRFDPLPVVGRLEIVLGDGREYFVEILQSEGALLCRAVGPSLPGDPFGGLTYELTPAKVRRLFPALSDFGIE